jgi:transcription elongation GreA/GreB family factor
VVGLEPTPKAEPGGYGPDTVKFGATVTLIDEDTDKKAVWQIVGEPEADASAQTLARRVIP